LRGDAAATALEQDREPSGPEEVGRGTNDECSSFCHAAAAVAAVAAGATTVAAATGRGCRRTDARMMTPNDPADPQKRRARS
jgi:hypothetical protein